jgi:hypothetical protein
MNNEYLSIFSELYEFSLTTGFRCYIWGGFVQDILSEIILREHKDIDCFIENMDINIEYIEQYFSEKGYQCHFNSEFLMLNIDKYNQHVSINPIHFKDNYIAEWKHIGNQGSITFPQKWLDSKYRIFYNIPVLTSGSKFEYVFRELIEYLNPEWKPRIKDEAARKYFRTLEEDNRELFEEFNSYNPFWLKKGYTENIPPVLVTGKLLKKKHLITASS